MSSSSLGEGPTVDQLGGTAMVGKTVAGKYEIVRMLGEGGMGSVYQARQATMDRMVALKLIRPEVVVSTNAVARFHKEMLITARVEHPNTIRVYDFGESDGQLYLVMEFLAGASLRQVLEGGARMEVRRIVRIAKQVANALGAIHQRGLVHRDLKPDNVMLLESYGETDFVKVLDFGIAKMLDEDVQLTATGRPIGTPAYMSPEQAMGRPVDHRTDLYALGVMLYRMTSGQMPFDAPTAASMLVAHATQVPPPITTLAPGTSPPLAGLIMQLLEKDPAARPGSAAEVVMRLERCLPAPDALLTPGTDPDPVPMPPRHGKAGVVVAMACLVAAGGGVAYFALQPGRPGPDGAPISGGAAGSDAGGGSAGGARTPTGGSAATADPTAAAAAQRKELDQLLEKAEPLAPDSCRSRDPMIVARLLDAARALAADRRDDAVATLGRPDTSEGWVLLSRAQLASDAGQAAASADEAIRLCPDYAVAHNLSGNALQKLGKSQPAEDAYMRALVAVPMYDAPRFNLGLLQLRRSDPVAVATFTELLRRRPDHPNAHLARAQAYLLQNNHADALVDLDEAVRRDPDSADAWAALAQLREHLKRPDAQAAWCRAKQLGHAKGARCKQ
jgi:Tfp pilus assembly protein PilF/predicted Ser/Thr protein kinase